MLRRPDMDAQLSPNPQLPPNVVVMIQLDALQNNDLLPADAGIRLAWKFASPTNRAAVGPIERFIGLVKNPLYNALIGFQTAELAETFIQNDRAQQAVRLSRRDGSVAAFIFLLSRQSDDPYRGCWMTDAVIPVDSRS